MKRLQVFERCTNIGFTCRTELIRVQTKDKTFYRVTNYTIDDVTGKVEVENTTYDSLFKAKDIFKFLINKWL